MSKSKVSNEQLILLEFQNIVLNAPSYLYVEEKFFKKNIVSIVENNKEKYPNLHSNIDSIDFGKYQSALIVLGRKQLTNEKEKFSQEDISRGYKMKDMMNNPNRKRVSEELEAFKEVIKELEYSEEYIEHIKDLDPDKKQQPKFKDLVFTLKPRKRKKEQERGRNRDREI